MKLRTLFLLTPALFAATQASAQTLVMAGGALKPDNAAVHRAFIDALPNPASDRIVIVPAASAEPSKAGARFKETLKQYGVTEDRVIILDLASEDDPDTKEVDEATWATNANDPALAAKIGQAGGVWFVGGDQLRLSPLLYTADQSPTLFLTAVKGVLARGGVAGGTSAGTAIMSNPMIIRGEGLTAAMLPVLRPKVKGKALESGRLGLRAGTGLFPWGVVDQHFDRDERLLRLARAAALAPKGRQIGFGIDENTALVVNLSNQTARPLGAGAVTIVQPVKKQNRAGLDARAAIISIVPSGNGFRLAPDGAISLDSNKGAIVFQADPSPSNGPLTGEIHDSLKKTLFGRTVPTFEASEYSWTNVGKNGRGLKQTFKSLMTFRLPANSNAEARQTKAAMITFGWKVEPYRGPKPARQSR